MSNTTLERELATFERNRSELEADHTGEWVVLHEDAVVGAFASFESAAEEAVRRFGRGPYLIRQAGAHPIVLPASVMFNTARATH
jgi:hypothetical protein